MSIYECSECGDFVDNDYHPCEVDPRDSQGIKLLCPECATKFPKLKPNAEARFAKFCRKMEQEEDDEHVYL